MLRLRAQVLGIVPVSRSAAETVAEQAESSVPAETRFKVGDICVRDGKKYRITRVDENGQALSGDELS